MGRPVKEYRVLIIDDDLRMRQLIGEILKNEIEPLLYGDSRDALQALESETIDMVITDLKMPYVDGITLLEAAKHINPDTVVILITGHGTIESAIEATKKGAYDYIEKPFEPDEFLLVVRRALEHIRLLDENKRLLKEVEGLRNNELIGTSRAINQIKELILKVAPLDATVLIGGETGTGKELVAKLIHEGSNRRDRRFLPVNCGAISESLLESELFGYKKGAFTGADRDKAGLFEAADGGTIFLDEVNLTSQHFQIKLLRVLQEGTFLKVGGTDPVKVDIRVISAANSPLDREAEEGRFRKDLYYRLNVIAIDIPPLRRRKEDIPILTYHFLNKYSNKYHKSFKGISSRTMEQLLQFHWPGNVRELENVIERAVITEMADKIKSVHLPKQAKANNDFDEFCKGLASIEEMEKSLIQKTLGSLNGQKAKASQVLGISPTSLWRKIKKYNLE